ncbi:MAG: DUF47 family protein [Bacteroidales bacterium]|nr:DUF47 family protein [Bacteroidales bacterium]
MKIDNIFKLFVPKDHAFFPLFNSASENLVKAAETLKKMMNVSEFKELEKYNKEIKEIELKGDDITVNIYNQLNSSFITPFDREDIQELASNMDDVLDSINGIGRSIFLYKPKKVISIYSDMAGLIYDASIEIDKAVHLLSNAGSNREKIMNCCNKIKDIEHAADELFFDGALKMFEKEEDTKELLKNSKILEMLERCVDEEEDVTDTLKAILIKMA